MCRRSAVLGILCLTVAAAATADAAEQSVAQPDEIVLSVVGTSDLHGHLEALPWFSGYLENLRRRRQSDGGVLLLDAGDMFQGTLESNLAEGAPVVAAYNALGYAAVAVGNHEFDFGPAGSAPSPVKVGDDPRGALKARAAEAHFPFLLSNVVDAKTGKSVAWPNVRASAIVRIAGINVGLVGAITTATPRSSLPANVVGLRFLPIASTINKETRRLRRRGATVVIAVMHEGGACSDFRDPDKLDSCDARSEVFAIARQLRGVDAIVAGHTHQAIAQRAAGIPIIQSYSNGRAFGRVDLTLNRRRGSLEASHIDSPHDLCRENASRECSAGDYEGQPVRKDDALAALTAPAFAAARAKGEERLGVEVLGMLPHNRKRETALGNLLADLMRVRHPADLALINGGGMRAPLPAGLLTYRNLYETFPFDNAFALVHISADDLRRSLVRSLSHATSLVSLSGVHVKARCENGELQVALERPDGKSIGDNERLVITTTDFLATGGDGFFADASISYEIGAPIRDAMAAELRRRGRSVDPSDRTLFDPANPRISLPAGSDVPVVCRR